MSEAKQLTELSGQEMVEVGKKAAQKARDKAFARGLPVYWDRKGLRAREYPNGRIEILEHLPDAAD